MSIASRITAMTEHIDDIYDTVELTGVDTTGVNKNLVNVPNTLKDGFVDIINNGVDTLYENFPKVAQTGEEPTLNGVYEAPMRVDLNGNTEQDSYTGKNLLNITNSGETKNGITYKKNEDGSITLNGTATANTNIRISTQRITQPNTYSFGVTTDISSYANQLECGGYIYNSDGSFKYNLSTRTGKTPRTISNGEYITNFFIYIIEGQVFNNLTLYPQLELGSTATSFEPYVGGTPSPNPDYPQPIRVVKGDNTIKVTGKNLLNVSNSYSVTTSQEVNINLETGTYSMSCTDITTDVTTGTSSLCNFYHSDNTFDQLYFSHTNKVGQITITAPVTKVKIYSSNSFNNSNGKTTTFTNLMIEKGSTATSYQPYQETTYPIALHGKNLCSSAELQSVANVRFYIDKKIEKTLTISFTTNESLNNNSLYLSATNTLATTITADANTKVTATFTLSDEQYNAIQGATNPYFLLFKSGANFTVPTDAQLENGSTATEYEPYYNYELCKIGDYKDEIRKSTGKNLFDISNKTGSRGNNTFTALNQEITINSNTSGTESAFYLNDVSQVSQYLATTYGNAMDFNMTSVGGTYTLTLFFNYIPTNNVAIALFTNKRTIQKGKSDWENTQCKWNITLDNDEYIKSVQFYASSSNVFSNFKIIAQLEKNNQATDYEPFGKVWYLKKNIGKVVLDGSESNWDNNYGINLFTINRYFNNKPFIVGYGLSNYYKYNSVQSGIDTNTQNGDFVLQKYNDQYNLFIKNTNYNNVSDFKTWLSTHNTIVYYVLATPTYTEITDTTLIEQLEDLKTAKSVEGQTNITQVNEELPFILDVSGLKKD